MGKSGSTKNFWLQNRNMYCWMEDQRNEWVGWSTEKEDYEEWKVVTRCMNACKAKEVCKRKFTVKCLGANMTNYPQRQWCEIVILVIIIY